MAKKAKIFVLDTNVILHDFKSLFNFQENDIVIPIAVLEELDRFKKAMNRLTTMPGNLWREIDNLTDSKLFNGGVSLGKGKGTLRVELGHPFPDQNVSLVLRGHSGSPYPCNYPVYKGY